VRIEGILFLFIYIQQQNHFTCECDHRRRDGVHGHVVRHHVRGCELHRCEYVRAYVEHHHEYVRECVLHFRDCELNPLYYIRYFQFCMILYQCVCSFMSEHINLTKYGIKMHKEQI
jgi:hypothetical protein